MVSAMFHSIISHEKNFFFKSYKTLSQVEFYVDFKNIIFVFWKIIFDWDINEKLKK